LPAPVEVASVCCQWRLGPAGPVGVLGACAACGAEPAAPAGWGPACAGGSADWRWSGRL